MFLLVYVSLLCKRSLPKRTVHRQQSLRPTRIQGDRETLSHVAGGDAHVRATWGERGSGGEGGISLKQGPKGLRIQKTW